MKRLVKFFILIIVIGLFPVISFAQTFGNEWIDYDQQYFKIHVSEDGIYKITYSELLSAGIPVNVIDPRGIQLFYKGEEQYIYIKGEGTSGIFDPTGYLEFYGKRNRGEEDLAFYEDNSDQVNPDYSFYNDTSAYFITWDFSISNRRMASQNSTDFSPYIASAQAYCKRQIRTNYVSSFYWGSTRCFFTEGEGWFDNSVITESSTINKTISIPELYSTSVNAEFEIAVVGVPANQVTSSVPHHLKVSFLGDVRIDEMYSGYQFVKEQINIPANQLSSSIQFSFSANDITEPGINDRNVVSYIDIKYPHSWDFENQDYLEFYLPSNSAIDKDYLEITNFNSGTTIYLYDFTNHERILVQNSAGTLKALVNFTDSERLMAICNQSGYKSVDRISKISNTNKFTDYFGLYSNADYLIITHEKLWSSCEQYATYRSSTGYNVALLDIDQLYNQYAYGINKHPIAIRNFNNELYNFSDRYRQMFLVGKSIHYRMIRNSPSLYANSLVPTAGNPSSDNFLTAGLGTTTYEPLVGTGRLSARENDDVLDYLNKITEYENSPTDDWMKRIVHFGGGVNSMEQSTFENYLLAYESVIEDTLFGGIVSTFLKSSSEPIQITQSDSVTNLINGGVTLMTFFGHASSSGFDQNIDFPENYENDNRFPFILANSCFSGDIHQVSSESISESWVNIEEKGSIGFLATVGEGIASYLNIYSSELYRNISYKTYGYPISYQIINATKVIAETYSNNTRMEITCHEFTLHGDPALVLNAHDKPDLEITASQISFTPNQISTIIDSFDVQIIVKNLGRSVQDTFLIFVDRTYADGVAEQIQTYMPRCNYTDTVWVKMPVNRQAGPGLNSLSVFVDAANQIDELSETNNHVKIDFLITSGDLFPIFPYNYAIYPNSELSLIASTGDPFLEEDHYRFQIDSTDTYNSPLLNETSTYSAGGLVSWDLPFELVENRVYYWRICRNHSNPDSLVWKESSFIYIEGEEGWSQAHYYQFKEDDYLFINYNPDTQIFDFVDVPKRINCHNTGSLWSGTYYEIGWNIDGAINNGLGAVGNCGVASAMLVAVIDPVTLLAWPSDIEDFGHRNYPWCFSTSSSNWFFSFTSSTAEGLQSMDDMINSIPDGHYVLVYSWGNGYFQDWPEQNYVTFENMGSTTIRSLTNGNPYIFFTKKGLPSSTQEVFGSAPSDVIDLPPTDLISDFTYGYINSVKVGPSNSWESFNWLQHAEEDPSDDEVLVRIFGITDQGEQELLIDDIETDTYEILDLGSIINYEQYPNLNLQFYTLDETDKTPAQIDNWQLRFVGVPETAIDPISGSFFCCDTLNEGDEISFAVATKNISLYDMDSLVVKYWLQDSENNITLIDLRTLALHPSGDILIDTITYSSLGLNGINSIWIEYNPICEETGTYYQVEQHHFNNIAVKYFFVQGDITNPILDVSFDGRYIMNGEIVSAKPEILIKLKDENQYLALNDTSLFRIFITDLQTGLEKRIYFSNLENPEETIEWIPADLPENSCKIIYNPIFEIDGMYRLRVQATDVSSNESGENDFVVDFEVITQATITHLLNYPNPFSTSTRFVFELTGSEVPDELRIEIFTVTGKLVKVIFIEELGPIHVGRNITEYAWNGKDMYGDQLANGVYFYQVKIRINGSEIDLRATEADKYFKREIGKMYLIR